MVLQVGAIVGTSSATIRIASAMFRKIITPGLGVDLFDLDQGAALKLSCWSNCELDAGKSHVSCFMSAGFVICGPSRISYPRY